MLYQIGLLNDGLYWAVAIIILGLICYGIIHLFVLWFQEKEKIYLFSAVLAFIFLLLFGHLFYESKHKDLHDFKYETGYAEIQRVIKIEDVIKEKEKDPEYVISIQEGTTTIPESIYQEYIGTGNNALTIKYAELKVYIGRTYPFGISTSFSGENDGLSFIYESRYSWPWEEDVQAYTEEDAKNLALLFLNNGIKPNAMCHSDMTGKLKAIE